MLAPVGSDRRLWVPMSAHVAVFKYRGLLETPMGRNTAVEESLILSKGRSASMSLYLNMDCLYCVLGVVCGGYASKF